MASQTVLQMLGSDVCVPAVAENCTIPIQSLVSRYRQGGQAVNPESEALNPHAHNLIVSWLVGFTVRSHTINKDSLSLADIKHPAPVLAGRQGGQGRPHLQGYLA